MVFPSSFRGGCSPCKMVSSWEASCEREDFQFEVIHQGETRWVPDARSLISTWLCYQEMMTLTKSKMRRFFFLHIKRTSYQRGGQLYKGKASVLASLLVLDEADVVRWKISVWWQDFQDCFHGGQRSNVSQDDCCAGQKSLINNQHHGKGTFFVQNCAG